jgi:heat shock protein HslJ
MSTDHCYNFLKTCLAVVATACYCFSLDACKTTYKADPQKTAATRLAIAPADSLKKRQQQGIDFFAEGDAPVHWTLDLDLEKGFSFKPADERQLIGPPVQATRATGTNADKYETTTDAGTMILVVYDEPCSGKQQDKRPPRRTEVTLNNKRYTGCGDYLYDEALNDIWTLETIGNKNPDAPVRKLPWIEFNLEKNKMYGYDGCNNLSSDIKVEGNRIKFSVFAGTKTACPGNETEELFSSMLSGHIVDYYIANGRLTLILINETKLIFIKKE